MKLTPAPLFTDVAPGPEGGAAYWAQTSDDVRIRIGYWPCAGAKGTVLLFPGRSEYVEKYGETAKDLMGRGYATLAVDWRGQGLADRLIGNRLLGHVGSFGDYQKDVAAVVRCARELALPRPFFLLAHSMGGCIGLRAVMEGLGVQAAAFTGPMWGIHIATHMRPLAMTLPVLMPKLGKGASLALGSKEEPYPLVEPFEDNTLTTDPEMWAMMGDQLRAHPELSLGGPTYQWVREALRETAHLAERAAPTLPAVTFVGGNERIVSVPRIEARMATWKGGRLEVIEGGEHELMLETPHLRTQVMDGIAALFLGTAAP